ncbi:uncharacterized protein [Rutidosis leptorrhynchoides]|uniref:uncharacterized protein n=1 Tax=Rutidosis leptorrhynchoides TaxID=125765 RepID=UPI003A99D924
MGIKHLRAYVDSKIVVQQVNGAFEAKDVSMKRYLQLDETLLNDVTEARWIKVSAQLYVLENDVLYRKSYHGLNLRCLAPQQALDVVKEMHEVLCAHHSGYRTIVARIMRYGLANEIVSDNGKQFAENPFKSWCEELSIKQTFTSVAHPQANDQVDVTNKGSVAGIKARLGLSQTKWVDKVPYVLWAHRTTPKWNTDDEMSHSY